MKEYGKICQLCNKRKESHMYGQKINDKWLRICKECWEKIEVRRKTRGCHWIRLLVNPKQDTSRTRVRFPPAPSQNFNGG